MVHISPFVQDTALTGGFLGTVVTQESLDAALAGLRPATITTTGIITPTTIIPTITNPFEGFNLQNAIDDFFGSIFGVLEPITQNEQITLNEQNLSKQIEALKNQIISQEVIKEQLPSTGSEIKDTLSKQLDSFAGAIGVSAATAAIILGGIAGILLIKK